MLRAIVEAIPPGRLVDHGRASHGESCMTTYFIQAAAAAAELLMYQLSTSRADDKVLKDGLLGSGG